jgi:phage-related protein
MADEIKVLIDGELTEQTLEKIKEGVSDSMSKGLEGKEEEFSKVFNFKNIKKDLGNALNQAWGNSSRVQQKQAAAMDKYKKAQSAVTQLVNTQNKGFGGSLKLVGAIGKQGVAGMSGMLAKVNPYVAAIKAAAIAAKFTADQFVRISKESAKFVGQGSLFTDKATMDMMQKTGQTATQAQATQRSLGDLGLDFSDIQQGKITAEQAAAFEKIRQRELQKLEEINSVAGPMFKSMQQVTLGFTLLLRDINDWITMAMAGAPGITSMLEKIKPFIAQVGGFMKQVISTYLTPIFSIIGDIFAHAMDIISGIMPVFQIFMTFMKPIYELVQNLFSIILKILGPIIKIISFLNILYTLFISIFSPLNIVLKLLSFLNPILEQLSLFLTKFSDAVTNAMNGLFETLKGLPIIGGLFKDVNIPGAAGGVNGTNITNSNSSFTNANTSNYIYGSSSMSQSSTAPKDLFSNSYTLIND